MQTQPHPTDRQLWRIAQGVHEQLRALRLTRLGQVVRQMDLLCEQLFRIQSTQRKLELAISHRWLAAASRVSDAARNTMRDIPYFMGEVDQALATCGNQEPPLRDIIGDLFQIRQEFEQVKYDHQQQTLSVVTDPIELDNIYLGEFEIVLKLGRLRESRHNNAYSVKALDPHPAATNSSVTHPHVSDEHLCEGDASAAIGSALANGRLCDFFLLCRSVLQQYNPSSPYVSLADWNGRPCHECGSIVSDDETYWCSACENDFCSDCISGCRRCGESLCDGCLTECSACGDRVCHSCSTSCDDCGRSLCQTCLEEGRCPCLEERKEEDDEQCRQESAAHHAQGTA